MRFIYVDNSNLWLAGQQVAGRRWSPDYEALAAHLHAGTPHLTAKMVLFGSGASHPVWTAARAAGFEVVATPRQGREKRVDTALVTRCMADSFQLMSPGDEVLLVSGDADFEPMVTDLSERGVPTTVASWGHSMSVRLGQVACHVRLLDEHLEELTHHRVDQVPYRVA